MARLRVSLVPKGAGIAAPSSTERGRVSGAKQASSSSSGRAASHSFSAAPIETSREGLTGLARVGPSLGERQRQIPELARQGLGLGKLGGGQGGGVSAA